MVSLIGIAVMVLWGGWIVWRRWHRGRADAAPVTPEGLSQQDYDNQALAQKSFAHGNTCLMEGRFAEASVAFHQARELDPERPHVAERLAEVARRQQALGVV